MTPPTVTPWTAPGQDPLLHVHLEQVRWGNTGTTEQIVDVEVEVDTLEPVGESTWIFTRSIQTFHVAQPPQIYIPNTNLHVTSSGNRCAQYPWSNKCKGRAKVLAPLQQGNGKFHGGNGIGTPTPNPPPTPALKLAVSLHVESQHLCRSRFTVRVVCRNKWGTFWSIYTCMYPPVLPCRNSTTRYRSNPTHLKS
jgi:hypothetical protein